MKVLSPSRCTTKLYDDLDKDYLIAEEKLDGSRYLLYVGNDPYSREFSNNTLLSRRISSVDGMHVDRSLNLPHICEKKYAGLEGTVLDGEIMANDFLGTNSVMNSSPHKAIQKQKDNGFLNYNVFDVLYFRGKNVRGLPLSKRRKILEEVVRRMNNNYIKAIPQVRINLQDYFHKIISEGGEGVIIKDERLGYGVGWAKMKKVYEVSCIISGYKPGNGKYENQVGSLAISVFEKGRLVEVGFASGFSDELRAEMTKNFAHYQGMVVDVYAQEIQKGVRLRHPTFYRLREDANPDEITLEKLKTDLKTKVKSTRWRNG